MAAKKKTTRKAASYLAVEPIKNGDKPRIEPGDAIPADWDAKRVQVLVDNGRVMAA